MNDLNLPSETDAFLLEQRELLAEYGKLIFTANIITNNLNKVNLEIREIEELLLTKFNTKC